MLNSGTFSADFAGPGAANTVPRSDGVIQNQTAAPQTASLRMDGAFRVGNETGTGEAQYPSAGMIYRRTYTTNFAAGQVVARTNNLTFERDGGGVVCSPTDRSFQGWCSCAPLYRARASAASVSDPVDVALNAVPTPPLALVAIAPCRLADTRGNGFTGAFGPSSMIGNASFPS